MSLKYFLAASKNFSQKQNFDCDNALKNRPYGGLIDKSSLDSYLNNSKILRLHAVLHDAGGFIEELYTEEAYMLPGSFIVVLLVIRQESFFVCILKFSTQKFITCCNFKQ